MPPLTGYRLLASNALAVLAGRVAAIGLGVLLATLLFRTLGPDRYGAWSLLTLLAGYSTLIDFGLAAAIERRVASLASGPAESQIPLTVNTALTALLALVVVSEIIVIALLALPWNLVDDAGLRRALLVLPLCTGLTLASLAAGAVLAGLQRMRLLYLCRTLGLTLGTVGVAVAVAFRIVGLDRLLVVYTAGSVATLVVVWRAIRTEIPTLRWAITWDREAARDLVWFGGVVQFATMVPPIAEYAFRLVVSARFGLAYAGVYDLGARAAVVPRSLAGALFTAMVPFAVQLHRRDGVAGMTRLTRTTVRHVALLILPGTVVLLAFAPSLIQLWLRNDPLAGAVLSCFELLLVAHALGALAVPAAMVGRALGRPAAEAIATTVAFGAAVFAASIVPTFNWAVGLMWALPATGGFIAWAWLGRRMQFGFIHTADFSLAIGVAVLTQLVARPVASWSGGPVSMLLRLVVVSAGTAGVALLAELSSADRRAALRSLLRPR